MLRRFSNDNFVSVKYQNMKHLITVLLIAVFSIGCKKAAQTEAAFSFVQKIEIAHQKEKFKQQEVIQFDLKLTFGGQEKVNGKVTLATNSSKGKVTFANGNVILFDGSKVYYSPEIDSASVRFDAFTWSYFFMFPYKLSDSGTQWQAYDNKEKDAEKFTTEKLTFKPETGDAPNDWYVVYSDKNSNLIQKAAYIVTAFGSKEEAEKNPHAIQYSNFIEVNAIPIASVWKFWEWNKNEGATKQIGEAKLTNIEFISNDDSLFIISENLKISNQ